MAVRALRRILVLAVLLLVPATSYAQEAVLLGTVTDSTGAVLPGVTVTATLTSTGNTFFSVTDDRGAYRIAVRIGEYQITAELAVFATVNRSGISVLVGQQVGVPIQMAPSGLQETVTVTGEAPLLNTTQSVIGSNIDARQMQDLPTQGRQWTSLALLAPGNRTTSPSENPAENRGDGHEFQLNMDGQQVTHNSGVGGEPRYSQDAIAEFQFISNRFDATQGRSSGIQVNAVSKSGTNRYAGSFSTSFRNDKWNAARFLTGAKNPLREELYSATFGGPVMRNKLHFFANYQLERTPKSLVWTTGYAAFDAASRDFTDTRKLYGLRMDYQLSNGTRMFMRGSTAVDDAMGGGGTGHPAAGTTSYRYTGDAIVALTSVLSNTTLNEVRVGFTNFHYGNQNLGYSDIACFFDAAHTTACDIPNGRAGAPRITFTGFSVGGNSNGPQDTYQHYITFRDDFTTSFDARGRHNLKMGGEFMDLNQQSGNCRNCSMIVQANRAALTTLPKTIDQYLGGGPGQDLYDSSTWDLNALSPLVNRTTVGIGEFLMHFGRKNTAAWLQDDWSMTDKLTLNLGLRYDLIWNAFAQDAEILPWLEGGRPNDVLNLQPRVGFAYRLTDKTVLRGGAGKYYGDNFTNALSFTYSYERIANIEYTNPATGGRADFLRNPWGGVKPSRDEAFLRFCSENGNAPGCLLRSASEISAPAGDFSHLANSMQYSFGLARQVTDVLGVEVDYLQTNSKNEKVIAMNANIKYDPVTGNNLPYSVVANRAYQDWGIVSYDPHGGWSRYRALLTAFTKRFSQRWQASGNYLFAKLLDSKPNPFSGNQVVTFKVAPDIGEDWGIAESDQRHRATVNGIYDVGFGFQISGLYFFGSGSSQQLTPGTTDTRDLGSNGDYANRKRVSGEIIPRNTVKAPNLHRVDMRFQQRIPLGGRVRMDAQVEVFNLFNRFNPSGYIANESNINYDTSVTGYTVAGLMFGHKWERGKTPQESANIAYAPRVMQFGFRMTF